MKNPRYLFLISALLVWLLSMSRPTIAQQIVSSHVPTGAINGLFSVSENVKVYFSKGNLQYIGSASNPYWKFAENQWDYFGESTGQNSNGEKVDRDLFGWGTSGSNHGAVCYQPWSTSTKNKEYHAYGQGAYNLGVQTGQADWGRNPIRNGNNLESGVWRTLTYEEWLYVFEKRITLSGIRYAKAQVNGVNGVMLLPDNWNVSYYLLKNTNQPKSGYDSNVIDASEWDVLEEYGAVFLPAAGSRRGKKITNVNSHGDYWSASCYNRNRARYLYFEEDKIHEDRRMARSVGHSVRLVHGEYGDSYVINAISNPPDGGVVSGAGVYDVGTRSTIAVTSNPGWVFVNWTENETEVSTNATYTSVVSGERNLVANFIGSEVSIVDGALDGVFSVSAVNQVQFSQGNLQFIGSVDKPYWKFAEHQWDYFGYKGQCNGSQNANRDLFGWGTSGFHDQKDPYNTNYQPWSTSIPTINESFNFYGYGPSTDKVTVDLTDSAANYDWGVFNSIVNGGKRTGCWRTLTREEWSYVFDERITPSSIRYAKAQVNGVNGVILLPDNWDASCFLITNPNQSDASFFDNVITSFQWRILEKHGVVFLPAAGDRLETTTYSDGSFGYYWSSSCSNGGQAWCLSFFDRDLSIDVSDRYYGQSVRLVRDVQ